MSKLFRHLGLLLALLASAGVSFAGTRATDKVSFNIPAQSADRALLAFAKQAKVAILFSYEDLRNTRSTAIVGEYDLEGALELLLRGTGFVARPSGEGKWVVAPHGPPTGTIKGKVFAPDGSPARRVRISVVPSGRTVMTDARGSFEIDALAAKEYSLLLASEGMQPLRIDAVKVLASQTTVLERQTLRALEDPTRLEPLVIKGKATHAHSLDHSDARFAGHVAGGNLDLTRTESDALPYMIFNRTQIARSGVITLSEFLQREIVDSTAGSLAPYQDPNASVYATGSNVQLRGYNPDETVILVNGRRMPEAMTSKGARVIPDVNFIPLGIVQQVEVLPVSASALYSGNAVGGVVNIVLRPDVDANVSELTATYTNAMAGFDAAQTSVSLSHAQALLAGALRVRVNATFSRVTPPTEAELGYRTRRLRTANLDAPVFGATPNVRTLRPEPPPGTTSGDAADQAPGEPPPLPGLFGPGTSPVTSVIPGSNAPSLSTYAERAGVRNAAFFDSPGSFSTGSSSLDFPYGREQQSGSYYGSVVYDATPWLQLAVDGTYSNTRVHRGYETMQADLMLPAESRYNPFGRDVRVSLNESTPLLGERYREARFDFASVVLAALIKLPDDWRAALDTQYSHNIVRHRGLIGAKLDRWQALVDEGIYNPLRDTQVFGPPQEFYDRVLIYNKGRGKFVTLGSYHTLDGAFRLTNEQLNLPTGPSVINLGTDFRRNHLASYTEEHRFSDGTLDKEPERWSARTLTRYSFFGELQTPMVPANRLPRWIREAEADLALRYVAASSRKEANLAPTYGAKLAFPGGIAVRGSFTKASRYPIPTMSRRFVAPPDGGVVVSPNREQVKDYRRNEKYEAVVTEVHNAEFLPESSVTQTAGVLFERGRVHRVRAAIDFVQTHKANEEVFLDQDKITANEALWPERVVRAAPGRGESVGVIHTVFTGRSNLSRRESRNWTGTFDYRCDEYLNGTIEAYARVLYFEQYRYQILPTTPTIDELNDPDGVVPLLKYRANFGASWSNKVYTVGADGHYFHSRLLPLRERLAQGHDAIRPFWQADVFVGADLTRLLPWKASRFGLRGQLRINNVLGDPFPKYVNDPYATGVQPYGDWRGRVYSLSLTATF